MAFRGFGVVTLAAAAVPAFLATTLGAASPVPAPDPHAFNQGGGLGSIEPGTNVPPVTLQVASSAKLRVGDSIIVVDANGTGNLETTTVLSIPSADTTHIVVAAGKGVGLTKSHANASLIIINNSVALITIQADAASPAIIYIGTAPTVAAADPSVIYELGIPVASPTGDLPKFDVNMSNMANALTTGQLWVNSTTGKFVASYFVI